MSRRPKLKSSPLLWAAIILLATCLPAAAAVTLTDLFRYVNETGVGSGNFYQMPSRAQNIHCYSDGTLLLLASLALGYEDPKRFLHPIVTGDPYLAVGIEEGGGSIKVLVRFHPQNQSVVWATQIDKLVFTDMDTDSAGNVYVTGPTDAFEEVSSSVSKYDSKGMLRWKKNYGSSGTSEYEPWIGTGSFHRLRVAEQGRVVVVAAVVNKRSPLVPGPTRTVDSAVLLRIDAQNGAVLGNAIVLPVSERYHNSRLVVLEDMVVSTDGSAMYLADKTEKRFNDKSVYFATFYRVRLLDGDIASRELPVNFDFSSIRISAFAKSQTSMSDSGIFVALAELSSSDFNLSIRCFRLQASLEDADWATGLRAVPSADQFILYFPSNGDQLMSALVLENGMLAVMLSTSHLEEAFNTVDNKNGTRRLGSDGSHPFTYPVAFFVNSDKNFTVSTYEVGTTRPLKDTESYAMCPSAVDQSALYVSTGHLLPFLTPLISREPKLFAKFAGSHSYSPLLPHPKSLVSSTAAEGVLPSADLDPPSPSNGPQATAAEGVLPCTDLDPPTPSNGPQATTAEGVLPSADLDPPTPSNGPQAEEAELSPVPAVAASKLLRNFFNPFYQVRGEHIHCFPDGSLLIVASVPVSSYYDPPRFLHPSVIGDPYLGWSGHIRLLVRFHPSNDSVVWASQIGYEFEAFVSANDATFVYTRSQVGAVNEGAGGPMIAKYDSRGMFVWKRYYEAFDYFDVIRVTDDGRVLVVAGRAYKKASSFFAVPLEQDDSLMVLRIDTESGRVLGNAVVLLTRVRGPFDSRFSTYSQDLAISADGGTAYVGVYTPDLGKNPVRTCTVYRVRFFDSDVVSRELPVDGAYSVRLAVPGKGGTKSSNSGVFVALDRDQSTGSQGDKSGISIEIYRLQSSLDDADWATGQRQVSTTDPYVLHLPSGTDDTSDTNRVVQVEYMANSGVLAVLVHADKFPEALNIAHDKETTTAMEPSDDIQESFRDWLILYVDANKALRISTYEKGGEQLPKVNIGSVGMCLSRDESSIFVTGTYNEASNMTHARLFAEFLVPQLSNSILKSERIRI